MAQFIPSGLVSIESSVVPDVYWVYTKPAISANLEGPIPDYVPRRGDTIVSDGKTWTVLTEPRQVEIPDVEGWGSTVAII